MLRLALALALAALPALALAQPLTRADTLRGSITPERAWWDVTFYDLHVRVDPVTRRFEGRNGITYRVTGPARDLQIDLQAPMRLTRAEQGGRVLAVRQDGHVWYVTPAGTQPEGSLQTVTLHFEGAPRVAPNAPWDGGVVWQTDRDGHPWIATAVQGLGASAWWPVKDTQADQPDSQRVAITVPDPLVNVSNGRLRSVTPNGDGTTTYEWFVSYPINNYNVAINAGRYARFQDTMQGEAGPLTLTFWPLAYNEPVARVQFRQAQHMIACFEHWFGPFPWYTDGFQVVETPHLGMEHQSANAYGNRYRQGYLGRDLSGTGRGLSWDFILAHEMAHEWWGNNITTADIADMWVHEAFANYAENLYVECQQGTEAGAEYVIGLRASIRNDIPIIGPYGVNRRGSTDMYNKGGNMLHTVRQLVGDDARWRATLRGLNETFRHQVVTGADVQRYMSEATGVDLDPVFRQYLTTTDIPTLHVQREGTRVRYRWADVVEGFAMPVRVFAGEQALMLIPRATWQEMTLPAGTPLAVDVNYYVRTRFE